MENRSLAPWLLTGASVAVVVMLALLLIQLHSGSASPPISQAELDRAAAAHARAALAPPAPRAPSGPQPRVHLGIPPATGRSPAPPPADDQRAPPPVAPDPPAAPKPAAVAQKMVEATQAYDRGDYEGALAAATEVLAQQPDNVKVLRIATSCACIMGDADKAHEYYQRMPARDQRQIARRCKRYGVEF